MLHVSPHGDHYDLTMRQYRRIIVHVIDDVAYFGTGNGVVADAVIVLREAKYAVAKEKRFLRDNLLHIPTVAVVMVVMTLATSVLEVVDYENASASAFKIFFKKNSLPLPLPKIF